jgi:hypothetical protein
MREIDFRGKVVCSEWQHQKGYQEKWVYGFYWTNQLGNHFIRVTKDAREFYVIQDFEVIPETVGQFTGLKDKNKKKIYEDDIVMSYANVFKSVVVYDEVVGGFQPFVGERTSFYAVECEVIGNNHDIPKGQEW